MSLYKTQRSPNQQNMPHISLYFNHFILYISHTLHQEHLTYISPRTSHIHFTKNISHILHQEHLYCLLHNTTSYIHNQTYIKCRISHYISLPKRFTTKRLTTLHYTSLHFTIKRLTTLHYTPLPLKMIHFEIMLSRNFARLAHQIVTIIQKLKQPEKHNKNE